MKFGIGIDASLGLSFDEQRSLVCEAAEAGYESAWTPSGPPTRDGFHVAAQWAMATASVVPGGLPVGIAVIPVPLWTVPSLTQQAGTLSALTAGRFVLGLGSGGIYGTEYQRTYGLPAWPVVRLMREYITTLRSLFAGEVVSVDGAAVKRTGPVSYAALIYFVSSAYMTPFIIRRHGWQNLKNEFEAHGWRLAGIGALIVTAYLMALWAYRIASVSYSGAIREVGVVMGAFAGWQFLGEKFGSVRVVGAIVIFAGILMIALFG